MKNLILARHNFVEIPSSNGSISVQDLGTILSNLNYYGYTLSKEALQALLKVKDPSKWWTSLEVSLKEITGDNRNMDKYVVYKNFPKEVLEMSQAEYWAKQLLMYWGLPNELFTQEELPREQLKEKFHAKVLHLAKDSFKSILKELLSLPSRWTLEQSKEVSYLLFQENLSFDIAEIPFKENMVAVAKELVRLNKKVHINSAMDVLRLAVGLSDGDISLKTNSKFKLSRKERKYLLSLLENCTNLEEDVARDKNKWRKLMFCLHPGDFNFKRVKDVYNKLYNNKVVSFNSEVEKGFKNKVTDVLSLLQTRPGVFVRCLSRACNTFPAKAVLSSFSNCVECLKTVQLVKLKKYLETINLRKYLTYPPKGNWTKVQVVENTNRIDLNLTDSLLKLVNKNLYRNVKQKIKSVNLDERTKFIKLQTNDSELSHYGRGTVFPIPDNINFLRSASYWEIMSRGYVWFDNGWNFFDINWKSVGTLCWNSHFDGAVFSGDPTNSKDMEGKACQMIDLYLDKLKNNGVRYAVWNILCYSNIPFNKAKDVYAALQWGENAQKGKTFEPSRCQLSFPVKGNNLSKYICYIDLEKREIVYMDANLYGNVRSAASNSKILEGKMPAFQEYLDTLPSVHDLFEGVRKSKTGTPILYDDTDVSINGPAYVFKKVNDSNTITDINISQLL